MKHAALISCAILSSLLTAQGDTQPQGRTAALDGTRQIALSDILGMRVRLQPSPEALAGAKERDESAGRPAGSIHDLILTCGTGEASWAAVSVGGMLGIGDRVVAVPRSALVWVVAADRPELELRATEAQLKALPEFHVAKIKRSDLARALLSAETSWAKARADSPGATVEASTRRVEAAASKSPEAPVLASRLIGAKVNTSDSKEFGAVNQGCYNLDTHCVDHLIVGAGGVIGLGETDYVVPYRACRVVQAAEDEVFSLSLTRTATELKDAPRYAKPDHGVVSESDARRAAEFYAVEHQAKKAEGDAEAVLRDTKSKK